MSLCYRASTLAILLSTFALQSARAGEPQIVQEPVAEAAPIPMSAYPMAPLHAGVAPIQAPGVGPAPTPAAPYCCPPNVYPRLNAALYPAPVHYTPSWNGGAIITNQALAPHEMLYPHRYHAMYPPFYYKVHGDWYWTPFGMRQHESWKLEGTEVIVNYRPRVKLFSGFHPPRG